MKQPFYTATFLSGFLVDPTCLLSVAFWVNLFLCGLFQSFYSHILIMAHELLQP